MSAGWKEGDYLSLDLAGKVVLETRVPGPQCLGVALTLFQRRRGRAMGERPWQGAFPSPDPEAAPDAVSWLHLSWVVLLPSLLGSTMQLHLASCLAGSKTFKTA